MEQAFHSWVEARSMPNPMVQQYQCSAEAIRGVLMRSASIVGVGAGHPLSVNVRMQGSIPAGLAIPTSDCDLLLDTGGTVLTRASQQGIVSALQRHLPATLPEASDLQITNSDKNHLHYAQARRQPT